MRKLASIQEIKKIESILGADLIESAHVMGWVSIVKKGEYSVGEKCVFFEVDSFLPIEPRYEFLRKGCFITSPSLGAGFRIKTQRLRGSLSQGLILPLSAFSDLDLFSLPVGSDITDLLSVRQWSIVDDFSQGTLNGAKPYGIPTSSEPRVQSYEYLLNHLVGNPYYITTKLDGSSMSVYCKDGVVGVCSHHCECLDTSNSYWFCANSYNLVSRLKSLGLNLCIQGELCGPKINKNRLKLQSFKFYVFDIVDLDTGKYLDLSDILHYVSLLGLDMVPIEEIGLSFNYSLDDLLEKSSGFYTSGTLKEGIVVRSQTLHYNPKIQKRLSFKVLNNLFLLKE